MKKYGYECFEDEKIEKILNGIKDNCYELLDCHMYGDYQLNIYNEKDTISLSMDDEYGRSESKLDINVFIKYIDKGELEKYLDNVLYYNYISYENL